LRASDKCSLDYIAYVDGYPEEDAKKEAAGMVIKGGGPVATALAAVSRQGAGPGYRPWLRRPVF